MAFINNNTSDKDLAIKMELIQALKIQRDELDDQITALEDSVKNEMTVRGVNTLSAGNHKATWTTYITHRFDSKALKAEHEDIFNNFNREVEARRFVIR